MAQCPICKSAAEEMDRGFFDGVGFDCRQHGRFRVTGMVIKLMESNEWTRRAWENGPDGRQARLSSATSRSSSPSTSDTAHRTLRIAANSSRLFSPPWPRPVGGGDPLRRDLHALQARRGLRPVLG
jgi:hypothetical protein